ncbi:MAG: Wzz/FepE/Etk N-terminal domain-containing protein, partial [Bacteroidota bacterium]|nr:Wzz/FepE/Etk N-terminal domain-containing protein [Bacteroidota bacterium]
MEEYNDEIQLKDILIKLSEYKVFLFKKKVAIIAFSFLFLLIGVVYASTLNTKYNAELTFVVEAEHGSGSLGSMAGIASQFGFDIGRGESSTFSQSNVIELLKSRGVIQNTLMQNAKVNSKNDLLIEHYFEINDLKDDLVKSNDFKGVSFHDNINYIQDSLSGIIWLTIIADHLTVEMQSNEANIITLSYTSLNQEFAKEFAERLISEMSKMYVLHKTAQANSTLDFLQNRADSVFAELEIAEQEFAKV